MIKKTSISLIIFSLLIIFSTSTSAFFGIDGYGTKNTIAKFINGEDIGNSSLIDDGNSVNVSNPIYVQGSQVCTADNGICYANGTISAGNPFDQSLNTSDDVHFHSIGTGLLFAGYLAKNNYYNYDDNINPYSHTGAGSYEVNNQALNMIEATGSSMNFLYIPATTHLNSQYKKIETNFTLSSSLITYYNSAVLTLDAQMFCGDEGCVWNGYNSCWQQYFSGVWYLGIYRCNNFACGDFATIVSDSGNSFTPDTNNRMVFERNESTFTCSLYDSTDTLLSSVTGSDSTYTSGYDGLMNYVSNVTYDNTNFTWSSVSAPMQNEAYDTLWNNNTWVGKVETALTSSFLNLFIQGTLYFKDESSYISRDDNYLHINTDKVIDINNQIQMNTNQPISLMQDNQIRWWDNVNNDDYDVVLYRGGDDLLKTDDNFEAINLCYSNGSNCLNQSTDYTNVAFTNQSNIFNGNQTISSGYYMAGQPIKGMLGSGILSDGVGSSTVNITCSGLDCSYDLFVVRLVSSIGTEKYCDIPAGTITITDNVHNVLYVDSNCAVQKTSISLWFSTTIKTTAWGFGQIVAHSGSAEVVRGAGIEANGGKAEKILSYYTDHLNVVEGFSLTLDTFSKFNISTGKYVYIQDIVDGSATTTSNMELHSHNGTGVWSVWNITQLNTTHCDNGTDLVVCSPTNKWRRIFIFEVGYNKSGVDSTELVQLAPSNTITYSKASTCLDTTTNPLSYTLPDYYIGSAVPLYAYCVKPTDSAWVTTQWIDLRTVKTGSASAGIDTTVFVPYTGATANVDLGTKNLTANAINIGNGTIYWNGTALIVEVS